MAVKTLGSNTKTLIVNRLLTLGGIQGVTVRVSKQRKTVHLIGARERSLDFVFRWAKDHFIGYFVDSKGNESQAVLSLWTPLDAIHFAASYSLLVELRASRREPAQAVA